MKTTRAAGGVLFYLMIVRCAAQLVLDPGPVLGWGKEFFPNVTPGTIFTNITTGTYHSLAIKNDGTLAAWGGNWYGQCLVPPGLSNVVAISGGDSHCLALKSDGTLTAWGYPGSVTNIPSGISNRVGIVAWLGVSLTLAKDGSISGWGQDRYGQLGAPERIAQVRAFDCGYRYEIGLLQDGTVITWGGSSPPVPPGVSNIISVAAGGESDEGDQFLALKRDGTVMVWGTTANNYGQTNVPPDLTNAIAIATRNTRGLALKADGTVATWGDENRSFTNAAPEGLSNVVAISCGWFHSLALQSAGTVVAWGENTSGRASVPADISNVVAIAAGPTHNLALRSDGTVRFWGDYNSQYYSGETPDTNVPPEATNIVAIAAQEDCSFAVRSDGLVIAWGTPYDRVTQLPPGLTNVIAVAAGHGAVLGLKSDRPRTSVIPGSGPAIHNGVFQVSVAARVGKVYRLECKDSLLDAQWLPLPLVAGREGNLTLRDTRTLAGKRFYRIREW